MLRLQTAIISLLLLSSLSAACRTAGDTSFARFAQRQDSLFNKAYESKNVPAYRTLLTTFLEKYDRLDAGDKKMYAGSYINAYYNLCCTYALLNNKPMAMESLKKAVGAGYYDYTHIMGDPDLQSIRSDEEFKTLVQSIRSVGDYRYILGRAAAYNEADQRTLPAFIYASASDSNLTILRKAFNLDSIAGTGNDVSQVINLLHWIHNMVPHDGMHNNPTVKNALAMIAVCKRDNRGLNCRGLATVLNECYLSMGFKSRFVTCLPKDSLNTDTDCHVINLVYIPSLSKWVWIDPTNDAYVMNEQGTLLSIPEVRARIIGDQPLIVNPDANWNHRQSTLKEEYLYHYMAKNLYMLECSVYSGYDTEGRKERSYIRLLPLDYFKQGPDKTVEPAQGVTFITYKTNNPDAFWAAPQ